MRDISEIRRALAQQGEAGPLLRALARWGGGTAVIALFTLLHAALVNVGYTYKYSIPDPPVMWPSAGLLLVVLWLVPLRLWGVILALQFLVEVATAALWMESFRFGLVSLYTLANTAGAVVGAGLARWKLPERLFFRPRELMWFVLATAVGALVSSLAGVLVHLQALPARFVPMDFAHMWQLWGAGQWAGIMTVAPVVSFWCHPLRGAYPELRLRSRVELWVLAATLVAASFYVLSAPPGTAGTMLQLPTTIVLLVLLAVMRLPPRWVVSLFALTVLTLAALATRDSAVLSVETVFFTVGQLQMFIVTLGLFACLLTAMLAESAVAARFLSQSQQRYRSFVEHSTEALWRIELAQPMPVSLPADARVAWFRQHAVVAEYSQSYEVLDPESAGGEGSQPWRPHLAWSAELERCLASSGADDFCVEELRFTVATGGRDHTFAASFDGVVHEGHLLRLWGVARDITELVELNASLLRERERLKSYARQISTAEEKARRATAVDLHDGIGQSLAGMAMTLEVAGQRATPDVKPLIDDVRQRLREVQERTRSMISDLSPPGLYELGLKAALQWLAVYLRGHDMLRVELDVQLREEAVRIETRVLVFKLVRELLRNVVKHAGVDAARVNVRGDGAQLLVEVSDAGKGFEWQKDTLGARTGGFGLWSIADRINEAGGEFNIDTAPGRGSRFEMRFPLRGHHLGDLPRGTRGLASTA
jgi:signal transduction histidine kinase